jgi:hypothetical protein
MTWEEASLLKQRTDYRANSTRENILRWHPALLRRPEPLRTECINWLRDRWENLEINDEQLNDELKDITVVRMKKYDNHSENWKLFYDSANKRYIKVYSKKIWTTIPQLKPLKGMFERLLFPFLDQNRTSEILPQILFMTENYIGLEWLSSDEGWRVCKEEDFVRGVLNTGIVTPQATNAARCLQKFHLASHDYFKKNLKSEDYKTYRDCRIAAQADHHEYGEDFSNLTDSQHKLYVGSHNFWPRDFVTRVDPTTGNPVIRFIDFENLQISDATENNYWYHKYKISTKSLYLQHYTQHVQLIKKQVGDTGPLKDNQFLTMYVYKDTIINKIVDL